MIVDGASFETEGFLVVSAALAPEACDALDVYLGQCPLETRKDRGVRFATRCIGQNAEAQDLVRQSVGSLVENGKHVLFEEVVETLDTYPGPYPAHQDAAYFLDATVSVVVALSPLGDERGGLWVAPKSHQKGLLKHESGDFGLELPGDASNWELEPLTLTRGDVVLVHPHLVHVMKGNPTKNLARLFSVILQ